jgi:hypothetical protein
LRAECSYNIGEEAKIGWALRQNKEIDIILQLGQALWRFRYEVSGLIIGIGQVAVNTYR